MNKKLSPYTSNGMGGFSPKNSNFTLGKLVGGSPFSKPGRVS
jgi:hypothetical protein